MRLHPFVARLVAAVPVFAGRVWPALSASVPAAYPAAYVLPLAERLAEDGLSGEAAFIEARLGVEIMVRHAAQAASGGPAQDALDDAREAVSAALVGFKPDPASGPLAFAGGRLLSFDAGLAVWRDEYVYTFIRSETP